MKIVFVKPNNISDHIQPSLGLGYLATACRKAGHAVEILDCIKENIKIEDLKERLARSMPDIVGIQCYTFDLKFVKEAIGISKSLQGSPYTVIGGPHPSAMPEDTLAYFGDALDFIFAGEAEKGLPMLLDALGEGGREAFKDIPGLVWRDEASVRVNPRAVTEDLDSLGMPAWDMIRPETYSESQHGAFFRKFPIAPIMVTRGCPFPCTFCAGNLIGGRKIRKHSVEFMLDEIRYLYDKHGIREFHIVDDNFTFDKEFAKELLRGLIALKLDISWATPNGVRVDSLDDELLDLMKESGLYLVSLGIESGSDRVLELMKKRTNVARIRKGVELIRSHGIDIAGFFITGFPGETREDIEKTIRFSLDLDLIRANFFTYLPFPGSASYKELESKNELDGTDWDRFFFMNASFVPKGLTRQGLKSLQRKAFFRFYLRPKIMWKNVREVKSIRHFRFLSKRFFHWIVMN